LGHVLLRLQGSLQRRDDLLLHHLRQRLHGGLLRLRGCSSRRLLLTGGILFLADCVTSQERAKEITLQNSESSTRRFLLSTLYGRNWWQQVVYYRYQRWRRTIPVARPSSGRRRRRSGGRRRRAAAASRIAGRRSICTLRGQWREHSAAASVKAGAPWEPAGSARN
jgi:hypothetical protein